MVKMMVFVVYMLTADGSVYATIKMGPVPAEQCWKWHATKTISAVLLGKPVRYDCLPAEDSFSRKSGG